MGAKVEGNMPDGADTGPIGKKMIGIFVSGGSVALTTGAVDMDVTNVENCVGY